MSDYLRLRFALPRDAETGSGIEDRFGAELWARGILGCEIHDRPDGRLQLDAYLPSPIPDAMAALDLSAWPGVEALDRETFADRDWLADYRAGAQPLEIGHRLCIDPRDPDDAPLPPTGDGRLLLRIPARNAFGTGSHASTRLVLEWLEDLDLEDRTVLDVGSGSGILCFTVLAFGARRAVGFDLDMPSVIVSRQNAALNRGVLDGRAPRFYAGRLGALSADAAFDLLLVNILPERIADELPLLLRHLRPGGRLLSSGNLWDRRDEIAAPFRAAGLELEATRRLEEWTAFLWRR